MPLKKPLLENEQLFFIHIPKCAGTTFINIIDQRFIDTEILPVHHDLKKLQKELDNKKLARYKFLRGHIPYDRLIPGLPTTPRMITFLRNPVDQFISYFQMRQRVPDPLVGLRETLANLSLEQFLDQPDLVKRFANNATRQIGGDIKLGGGKFIPNLERAKERLATFDLIGITEHFDESLELLSYIFDFAPINAYETLNVSPGREKRKEVPQDLLDRVAEIQQFDIELYKFGLEIHKTRRETMSKEKAAGSPQITPGAPLQKAHVDFRRVNPGMGWHVGEAHPLYGCTRWSGPGTASYLQFHLEPNPSYKVRFKVIKAVEPEILQSLNLDVNGVSIPLKSRRDLLRATIFEGVIPGKAITAGIPTTLALKVNRTSPIKYRNIKVKILTALGKQFPSPSGYERLAGLCYQWLEIYPA